MSLIARMHEHRSPPRLDVASLQARASLWAAMAGPLLLEIADPRGRCNRKAFLHIALTFLGLQTAVAFALWLAGIELSQTGTLLLNAPVLWIGTTICVKRLHDVGRSGWWIPGGFGVWMASAILLATTISIICGPDAVDTGRPLFFVVFAAITLPAFGALVWLHTAPSIAGPNTFGPVATGHGLSMPTYRPSYRRLSRTSRAFWAGSVLA